jgi:hypothetical protein
LPTPAKQNPGSDSPGDSGRDRRLSSKDRDLGALGQHHAQDLLEGEYVDAGTPALEEVAGAMPGFTVESNRVNVVVAFESHRELLERNPIQLTGIAVRLLDLPNERAVHYQYPPSSL